MNRNENIEGFLKVYLHSLKILPKRRAVDSIPEWGKAEGVKGVTERIKPESKLSSFYQHWGNSYLST